MKAGVFLALFGILWTAIIGTFDVFAGHSLIRQWISRGYPSVPGTVTHSEVTRRQGGKGGDTCGVRIGYTYFVAGSEYHGDRYRYGAVNSTDSDWAHATVAAHPVGGAIRVFYNPRDPSDALLDPGVDGGNLALLLFLTPFNVILLGLWTLGGSVLWHRWRKTPAGGVPIRVTRQQMRICLAEYGPWAAGAVALGLSAFAADLAVLVSAGGFHPRMPVIATAWTVVLGISATAIFRQWRRLRTGRFDLVLDLPGGWMELPAGEKGATPRRLPTDAVTRVDVEVVTERTAKGGTAQTHVPVLRLRPGHGEDARLGGFHIPGRAEAFAQWLRQRLGLKDPGGDRSAAR